MEWVRLLLLLLLGIIIGSTLVLVTGHHEWVGITSHGAHVVHGVRVIHHLLGSSHVLRSHHRSHHFRVGKNLSDHGVLLSHLLEHWVAIDHLVHKLRVGEHLLHGGVVHHLVNHLRVHIAHATHTVWATAGHHVGEATHASHTTEAAHAAHATHGSEWICLRVALSIIGR